MLPNADSFHDLCPEDKQQLLEYISKNFKMIQTVNKKHSAYGLKARFNRLTGANKKHHITSNVIYLSLPSVKLRNLSFAKRLFLSRNP